MEPRWSQDENQVNQDGTKMGALTEGLSASFYGSNPTPYDISFHDWFHWLPMWTLSIVYSRLDLLPQLEEV